MNQQEQAFNAQQEQAQRQIEAQQRQIEALQQQQRGQQSHHQQASGGGQEDITSKLQKLADLHQKGLLTDDEFSKMKMNLLAQM
jgi:multidrug resistance efflux pump